MVSRSAPGEREGDRRAVGDRGQGRSRPPESSSL